MDPNAEHNEETSQYQAQNIFGSALAALLLILLLFTALLVALSFPAGIYTVFFTHLSNSTAGTLENPFLWIGPVALVVPIPVATGVSFAIVLVIYIAMFTLAIFQGRSIPSAVASGLKKGFAELLSNRALLTLVAIGFLVFTAGLIDEVVVATGAPIGNPFTGGDDLLTFVGLALAPLREELGFRVLVIGIAAVVVTLPRPGMSATKAAESALKTLWRPSVAYEGVDNNILTLVVIWAASAVSAGTFGACHVACGGGGWELGKLPEATYGGVVLAYLYIKYGFHVAVLAHWGIDYFPSVFAFYGQGVSGIPWASSPGYILQQIVASDLSGIFGLACTLAVAYLGLTKLWKRETPSEPPPSSI